MNDTTIGVLRRPFTDIKTRPGHNGQQLSYIEGHQVIARLIEAFGLVWSFRVLQHEIGNHQVIVLGELRVGDTVKQAFGGSDITRARNGDGQSLSVADDLKSAATDALKKAATLFGVGLHLYGDDQAGDATHAHHRDNGARQPFQPNGNDSGGSRLTRKQLAYIHRLSQDAGMDRADLETLSRAGFGKTTANLTTREASDFIDQLRSQQGASP